MGCVAITGATGFVGRNAAAAFAAAGWQVRALARRAGAFALPDVPIEPYDLADEQPPQLAGVDALIHCAYARAGLPNGPSINVTGSARLFAAARASGVPAIVFVSSLASDAASHSRYGREKYAIEALLDPTRDIIVRPGLVIGDGGLFAAMTRAIVRFRVAPLVDGGTQPVYTIGAGDLANALLDLVCARAHGRFVLAAPQPVALREIYAEIARRSGQHVWALPVPFAPLLVLALVAAWLRVPTPVSAENLRGLRNLRAVEVPRYAELTREPRPFPGI